MANNYIEETDNHTNSDDNSEQIRPPIEVSVNTEVMENHAHDMNVPQQNSVSPDIPPPPPDIPEDWIEYTPILSNEDTNETNLLTSLQSAQIRRQRQRAESAPNSYARNSLLSSIRSGTNLKHVEIPEVRNTFLHELSDPQDVKTELRNTLLSKRVAETNVMNTIIKNYNTEIKNLTEILTSARTLHLNYNRLCALLDRGKVLQTKLANEGISSDMLIYNSDWPTNLLKSLEEIISHMGSLILKVTNAEQQNETLKVNQKPVSNGSLIQTISELTNMFKIVNEPTGQFQSLISYFEIDSSELQNLLERARSVVIILLNLLVDKAFIIYETAHEPGLKKIDRMFRVKNAYLTLKDILVLCLKTPGAMHFPAHPRLSELKLKTQDLQDIHTGLQQGVNSKTGPAHVKDVELTSIKKSPPQVSVRPKRIDAMLSMDKGLTTQLLEVIAKCQVDKLPQMLITHITTDAYSLCEPDLIHHVVNCNNTQILDIVLDHREKLLLENQNIFRKDYDWLKEACVQGNGTYLKHFVELKKFNINSSPINQDVTTVFLGACWRFDYHMMIVLLELGADPTIKTGSGTTPLQYIAMKKFSPGIIAFTRANTSTLHVDFSSYINNNSLSDIILISNDGKRFFAHKIILCTQSHVFKQMMESENWKESLDKECKLPTIRSQVLSLLLQYLYTGDLNYPKDDLTLGVELLACAQQYLVDNMQKIMESALSTKIDNEVVIEIYHAAYAYNATNLYTSSCYHLLMNYSDIDDPHHACLLHLCTEHLLLDKPKAK